MAEARREFDQNFKDDAVRLVREKSQPIAEVARDLGINAGTLGTWVNADKRRRGDGAGAVSEDERAEQDRLRLKNNELVMELDRLYMENAVLAHERDALRRSVALWVSLWRTGGDTGPGVR